MTIRIATTIHLILLYISAVSSVNAQPYINKLYDFDTTNLTPGNYMLLLATDNGDRMSVKVAKE